MFLIRNDSGFGSTAGGFTFDTDSFAGTDVKNGRITVVLSTYVCVSYNTNGMTSKPTFDCVTYPPHSEGIGPLMFDIYSFSQSDFSSPTVAGFSTAFVNSVYASGSSAISASFLVAAF